MNTTPLLRRYRLLLVWLSLALSAGFLLAMSRGPLVKIAGLGKDSQRQSSKLAPPVPRAVSTNALPAAPVQMGGNFNLVKAVISAGGDRSAAGNTTASVTIGQGLADASSGAQFTLTSGLWGGGLCPVITVTPLTLPNGTVGTNYNQTITASGGAAPYTFSVSAGALPNGLTLTTAGVLSGPPSVAGTFNFTLKATDGNGCLGTRAYTLSTGTLIIQTDFEEPTFPPLVGREFPTRATRCGRGTTIRAAKGHQALASTANSPSWTCLVATWEWGRLAHN